MNKNANSADVRHLTRAIAKAQRKRGSLLKSIYSCLCIGSVDYVYRRFSEPQPSVWRRTVVVV